MVEGEAHHVGALEHDFYLSIQLGSNLIPTDELIIFQRGRYPTIDKESVSSAMSLFTISS